MLLALLATAVLLPAGPLHVDQTAAEQRLIGDALDRLRAGMRVLEASVASAGTPVAYVETWRGSPYLIYIIITEYGGTKQEALECEFALSSTKNR